MRSNQSRRTDESSWMNYMELATVFGFCPFDSVRFAPSSRTNIQGKVIEQYFDEKHYADLMKSDNKYMVRIADMDLGPRIMVPGLTDQPGKLGNLIRQGTVPYVGLGYRDILNHAAELMLHDDYSLYKFHCDTLQVLYDVLVKFAGNERTFERHEQFLRELRVFPPGELTLKNLKRELPRLKRLIDQFTVAFMGAPATKIQRKRRYRKALEYFCGGSRRKERSVEDLEIELALSLNTVLKVKPEQVDSYFSIGGDSLSTGGKSRPTGAKPDPRVDETCLNDLVPYHLPEMNIYIVDGIWRTNYGRISGGRALHEMFEAAYSDPKMMKDMTETWRQRGVPPSLATWKSKRVLEPSLNWALELEKEYDRYGLRVRDSWIRQAECSLVKIILLSFHEAFERRIPDYRQRLANQLALAHKPIEGRPAECPEHLVKVIQNFADILCKAMPIDLQKRLSGVIECVGQASQSLYGSKSPEDISKLLERNARKVLVAFWSEDVRRNLSRNLSVEAAFLTTPLNDPDIDYIDPEELELHYLPFRSAYIAWRNAIGE